MVLPVAEVTLPSVSADPLQGLKCWVLIVFSLNCCLVDYTDIRSMLIFVG